jgi:uncharacterized protein
MKLLLLLLVAIWAIWLWKRSVLKDVPRSGSSKPPGLAPQALRACAHCGVHAEQSIMVQGRRGWYCVPSHLNAAGDSLHHA